ncbi:MAG: hypothetical protein AB2421_20045 [Thermotaleaceae bacterium]
MLEKFKEEAISRIKKDYDNDFVIKDEEWEEVLDQVTRHLIINHIFFLKDIQVEDYFDSIWKYMKIKKRLKP